MSEAGQLTGRLAGWLCIVGQPAGELASHSAFFDSASELP